MGLIQFVKEVGRRLGAGDAPPAQSSQSGVAQAGPDAQKAAALVQLVEQTGLAVEHLGIQVDDRLQVAQPAPEARFYTVKRGDTLSKIAQAQYGDANQYPRIFEANRPLLRDPDEIYPGQTLRIPQ